ncbi:MAG: imidazolonepropionase [Actinomycetota bacterium]
MARTLRCSFCGRSEAEADRIVAGPHRVGICAECIELAREVALPSTRPASGELLVTNISELVTNDPRRGPGLGLVDDAAIAILRGEVAWVGGEADLPGRYRQLPELDCEGRAVIPGFVDSHTHLVFGGERSREFAMRMEGASYLDIQTAGGGIISTVAATRSESPAALLEGAAERAEYMLEHGTTTVEIKSGYGLEPASELTSLEVARQVGEALPIDVVVTFLGAHQIPSEFAEDRTGYLRQIEEEMLPLASRLATYCDVFCDRGAFTVEEAHRVLTAGQLHGLRPRLHANQLGNSGGVELAASIGAVSADHLEYVDEGQAAGLARAGVVAVLCPTASWAIRSRQAPGPMLWEQGVTVALASDCNPGTSYVSSMQLVIAVACLDMGLSLEQALWSATRGGALALEEPRKGRIRPGDAADLVVLEADSYRHLGYRPDTNLAKIVLKQGDPVTGRFPHWPDSA